MVEASANLVPFLLLTLISFTLTISGDAGFRASASTFQTKKQR